MWGWHCWWRGGRGWVLCWMEVWVSCWVLWAMCVRLVRVLRPLAGHGVEIGVGCLGMRQGLLFVGGGRLLIGGARRHRLRVRVLSVVVGCSV